MSRTKKIWPVILLCVLIFIAVCMVAFLLGIGEIFDIDTEQNKAAALGIILFAFAAMVATPMICGFLASVGFVIAIVNVKISEYKVVKGISIGFAVLYGIILLCAFAMGVYIAIMFV